MNIASMILRKTKVLVFGCAAALSFCGQQSAKAATDPANLETASPSTIIRLHWLGKKNISADTNSAGLMKVWNSPESRRLETQTLDKLASAPWRLLFGETNRASFELFRPLMDDLAEDESYIEVRRATNSPNVADEMVLAIRLNDQRSALWEKNLAAAFKSLTGIAPKNFREGSHWALKKHHAPNLIEYVRKDEWTIVGAAEDHNRLLDEIMHRIERAHVPFVASATNSWLDGEMNLAQLVAMTRPQWDLDLPADLPEVSFSMTGDGQRVRTRAQIHFPEALPLTLEPWTIPTNLINGDLSSLTALRGAGAWLLSGLWRTFETNSPPNQLYVWAVDGVPMEMYLAAPSADASNTVSRLTDFVLDKSDSWFGKAHDLAGFRRAKTFNGLEWKGVPYIFPFLKSTEASGRSFITSGFFPLTGTNQAPPQPLIHEIQSGTNLVYCDWELTGSRLMQWNYITQLMRVIARKPELSADSAGLQWLQSMSRTVDQCSTEIVRKNDREWTLRRSSSVGFTAIELELLVGWLESPQFPAIDGWSMRSRVDH